METVCFERKAFEEFAMKIERFNIGWRESPSGFERREEDGWLARPPGCLPEAENQQAHLADLAG